jgi:predicted Holliday junction resolvase-like endonuclease
MSIIPELIKIFTLPVTLIVGVLLGAMIGILCAIIFFVPEMRRIKKYSLDTQRSVVKGKISEQIAPLLPGFPSDLKISEARFMGSPIDFVFFKGLEDGHITEVVFVEVKSGSGQNLNPNEVSLRDAINAKQVKWMQYNIPVSSEL